MSDKKDLLKPSPNGITKDTFERRIVRPSFVPSKRIKPHINDLLDNAYSILQRELEKVADQQARGDRVNAGDLQKHIDSLTKLAREEREQEAKSDPAQMDDEALLKAVKEAEEILVELVSVDGVPVKGDEE